MLPTSGTANLFKHIKVWQSDQLLLIETLQIVEVADPWLAQEIMSRPGDFDRPMVLSDCFDKVRKGHGEELTRVVSDHVISVRDESLDSAPAKSGFLAFSNIEGWATTRVVVSAKTTQYAGCNGKSPDVIHQISRTH